MIKYNLRKVLNLNFSSCGECCPRDRQYCDKHAKSVNLHWGVYSDKIEAIFITDLYSVPYVMDDRAGVLFQKFIENHVLTQIESFYVLPAIAAELIDGDPNYGSIVEGCLPNTLEAIQKIIQINYKLGEEPPRIIFIGGDVIRLFFKDLNLKKTSIAKLSMDDHTDELRFPGCKINMLPSPRMLYKNPRKELEYISTLNRIFSSESSEPIDQGSLVLIEDMELFNQAMDSLKQSKEFAFDIETSGLNYGLFKTLKTRKSKTQGKIVEEGERKDSIIGISFADSRDFGIYIPLLVKGKIINRWISEQGYEILDLEPEIFYSFIDLLEDPGNPNNHLFVSKHIIERLRSILEDPTIEKIAQNGKFDTTFLKTHFNITVKNFSFDTLLAAHLVNEEERKDLGSLADRFRYYDLSNYKDTVLNELTKAEREEEAYANVDLNTLYIYGAKDAIATFRLKEDLIKAMETEKAKTRNHPNSWYDGLKLLKMLYMPLQDVYARAERHGILFDFEYANNVADIYEKEIENFMLLIDELIEPSLKIAEIDLNPSPIEPHLINLNSPKQMKTLLFEVLNAPVMKQTAKAKKDRKYSRGDIIETEDASTDQETLKKLIEYYQAKGHGFEDYIELLEAILEAKKRQKIINTYLKGKKIINRIDDEGYVHYVMKIHGTVSGRLSSTPNVQNLPKKTKTSNTRGIFIPPPGFAIFSADLSQAELRLMADYANDLVMLEYIKEKVDIHWLGCLLLFYHGKNLTYDPRDPQQKRFRKLTKLCNFGRLYGAATEKVVNSVNEKLDPDEERLTTAIAEAHGEWFFSTFYRIAEYLKEAEAHILKHGWIDSKFGRRRRLPDVKSSSKWIKAEAVRQGINAQIQGTASDITQFGAIKVDDFIQEQNLKSKVLWSVHDELDGIVHLDEIELMSKKVPELMVTHIPGKDMLDRIKVKLESEFELFPERWGESK